MYVPVILVYITKEFVAVVSILISLQSGEKIIICVFVQILTIHSAYSLSDQVKKDSLSRKGHKNSGKTLHNYSCSMVSGATEVKLRPWALPMFFIVMPSLAIHTQ